MGRIRIYPYRQGSRSARALADALGGRVLRRENSRFVVKHDDIIINWGAGECPYHCINDPEAVTVAGNKLLSFRVFRDANVSIPRFAETRDAVAWDGTVVVRHQLRGHSGAGIEIRPNNTNLPAAPLYVEYIKKEQEYRVHAMGESIIAVQRKARDRTNDNPNWQVRNHANGFIFVRTGFEAPQAVLDLGRQAVSALGLHFGAADIVWNAHQRQAYVLEVNTAPGLEGQTVEDYANAFQNSFRTSLG